MSTENSASKILSAPELRRFQHQINLKEIGLKGQETLKAARVMVIGAGGIGAQVLQFLGATGVGNITIVDDELVSEKAIQLQSLYGGNDLGKLKTIVSRQHLQHLYPLTRFEILNLRIILQVFLF
jgi:adenylyltransferase/sulfurtransferase